MHVLIIPSERMLPPEDPIAGIFQYHQAVALHKAGIKVGIVAPAPRSMLCLSGLLGKGWPMEGRFPFPAMINQRSVLFPGRFSQIMQLMYNRIGKRMFRNYLALHGRPDLLHAHNVVFAGICCQGLADAEGIPYVITEHSSAFSTGSIYLSDSIKKAFRGASARIMVSPFLGAKVEEMIGVDDATPWEYIPNIIESRFAEEMVSDNTNTSATFRFLCIAQFVPIKNHIGLVNAFASVFRGRQNIELVMGGDGPLLEAVRASAAKCQVFEQVKFLGFLPRAQLIAEIYKCNALVLPSFSETFGVALIEAMACGKPVVAPSGSGCEVIVNKDNGILFRSGDFRDLSHALEKMLDLAGRLNPTAIRNDCLRRFGEAAVVSQLIDLYERVLSKHAKKEQLT